MRPSPPLAEHRPVPHEERDAAIYRLQGDHPVRGGHQLGRRTLVDVLVALQSVVQGDDLRIDRRVQEVCATAWIRAVAVG